MYVPRRLVASCLSQEQCSAPHRTASTMIVNLSLKLTYCVAAHHVRNETVTPKFAPITPRTTLSWPLIAPPSHFRALRVRPRRPHAAARGFPSRVALRRCATRSTALSPCCPSPTSLRLHISPPSFLRDVMPTSPTAMLPLNHTSSVIRKIVSTSHAS